jgi:hypothetical protein
MCIASAVGFLLLVVAFLACGAGFAAPYWIYHPMGTSESILEAAIPGTGTLDKIRNAVGLGRLQYEGLLGKCFAGNDDCQTPLCSCKFFWEDDFAMEREIRGLKYRIVNIDISRRIFFVKLQRCYVLP